MKKNLQALFIIVFCCLSLVLPGTGNAAGDLEWTAGKQLKLDASPLDIASSADGKWMFVLTKGEMLVYAAPENKLIKRIPLDQTFDKLAYSAPNNSLILSSSAEKTLKLIQLELVHHFSFDGLAVQGPKNAPVTLVVFSDYQ